MGLFGCVFYYCVTGSGGKIRYGHPISPPIFSKKYYQQSGFSNIPHDLLKPIRIIPSCVLVIMYFKHLRLRGASRPTSTFAGISASNRMKTLPIITHQHGWNRGFPRELCHPMSTSNFRGKFLLMISNILSMAPRGSKGIIMARNMLTAGLGPIAISLKRPRMLFLKSLM